MSYHESIITSSRFAQNTHAPSGVNVTFANWLSHRFAYGLSCFLALFCSQMGRGYLFVSVLPSPLTNKELGALGQKIKARGGGREIDWTSFCRDWCTCTCLSCSDSCICSALLGKQASTCHRHHDGSCICKGPGLFDPAVCSYNRMPCRLREVGFEVRLLYVLADFFLRPACGNFRLIPAYPPDFERQHRWKKTLTTKRKE